jgi:hypothetical protein
LDKTPGWYAGHRGEVVLQERSTMTSVAATHEGEAFNTLDWVVDLVIYTIQLAVVALVLGGVLNMLWNPFSLMFSFLDPIPGGYWGCVLVALGAWVVYGAYMFVRDHKGIDLRNDFAGAATLIANALAAMGLAYVVIHYCA